MLLACDPFHANLANAVSISDQISFDLTTVFDYCTCVHVHVVEAVISLNLLEAMLGGAWV